MENKPYVFISYAHLDSDKVLPCLQEMRQNNINLWYDEGIQAGSEWPEFIAEKVVACDKFVLFVSNAYLQSQNCKRELNFAISRKKTILSVFLEDVDLSPGMEMQLGTYQAIYRNRFNSPAAFHSSLCLEQFFDSCRTSGTESTYHYAKPQSEPVHTVDSSAVNSVYNSIHNDPAPSAQKTGKKNKIIAALLAFVLGAFGVHKFYLGKKIPGIIYLCLCWTYIPIALGIFECIQLLLMPNETFDAKYNQNA